MYETWYKMTVMLQSVWTSVRDHASLLVPRPRAASPPPVGRFGKVIMEWRRDAQR